MSSAQYRTADVDHASPLTVGRADYVYGIDAVRFAAALMVAAFHLTWRDPATAESAWAGWAGVQVFFVVSGFVIANSANNTTPIEFLRSRALRLYPAAWVCAVLSVLVLLMTPQEEIDLARRFVASFVLAPVGPFLASAYWTLPVELAFYALVFVLLLGRWFHRLPQLAIALCCASSAYLGVYGMHVFGVIHAPELEFEYGIKNLSLLRHGIYFGLGMLLWLWSQGKLTVGGTCTMVLACLAALVEITCRSVEFVERSPVQIDLWDVWLNPIAIWVVSTAAIVAATYWREEIARLPAIWLQVLRIAGLATYPLYLLHEVHGHAVRSMLVDHGVSPMISSVAATLFSIGVAVAVAVAAEPIARRWLRRALKMPQAVHRTRAAGLLYRSGGVI